MVRRYILVFFAAASAIALGGCQGLVNGVSQLTVNMAGAGQGTVVSSPAGISCPPTCSATFKGISQVTLTASPGTGFGFGGWSLPNGTSSGAGNCNGSTNPCNVSMTGQVTATFTASLKSINHIIFLAQENRSFDSYFGALRQYWSKNGYPDQAFNGLPQFNPAGDPNAGPAPTNPGCGSSSTTNVCIVDSTSQPVSSFHFQTECMENPSPSWNDAHVQWDYSDPVSPPPASLNGFVEAAANEARQNGLGYHDVAGMRAMGYYDGTDLNYYYFMASNFATSDNWFAPVMTRTAPNREYLIAATSHGYVYPLGTNGEQLIPDPPIFQILDQQNPPITWKIYIDPNGTGCAPSDSACLLKSPNSYLDNFTYANTVLNTPSLLKNIVPITQFASDAANGTLPQVAQIEPASTDGRDEHPSDFENQPSNIQIGASYVEQTIINPLMSSPSWNNSVFILTFDEWGGLYDHVPPQAAVSPDGIAPSDLLPGDTCTSQVGQNCNFVFTGYRVPLIVVSPYAKKNFVSHTFYDETAILKLIETRFGLHNLTARDAAQADMSTDFFDFTNAPWKTPPSNIPTQTTSGACYLDHLP